MKTSSRPGRSGASLVPGRPRLLLGVSRFEYQMPAWAQCRTSAPQRHRPFRIGQETCATFASSSRDPLAVAAASSHRRAPIAPDRRPAWRGQRRARHQRGRPRSPRFPVPQGGRRRFPSHSRCQGQPGLRAIRLAQRSVEVRAVRVHRVIDLSEASLFEDRISHGIDPRSRGSPRRVYAVGRLGGPVGHWFVLRP